MLRAGAHRTEVEGQRVGLGVTLEREQPEVVHGAPVHRRQRGGDVLRLAGAG